MGAFRYDNPLMNALVRIANLMILSFFWLLCSLPLVTLLPASAGLYHTMVKVVRGSGSGVAGDFFKSFAGACKKGVLLSLIAAAAGGALAYALYFGAQAKEKSVWGAGYFLFGVVIAVILVSAVLHMIPALARFEGGLSMYIRMGLYFAGKAPLKTLLRLVLLAVTVFLADFYPIALLILPGVYMDLVSPGMEKQLQSFMEENGLEEPSGETGDGEDEAAAQAGASMPSIELDRMLGGEEDEDE